MDRPGLMYDVFEAAQIAPKGEIIDADSKKSRKEKLRKKRRKKRERIFATYLVFLSSQRGGGRLNNASFWRVTLKREKTTDGIHSTNLILLKKAIRKLKG